MSNIKELQKELQKKGYNIKFASNIEKEEKIKTGIFALDYVLGGGIGKKHRIEFWGKEGGGKSLMSLLTIKKFQEFKKTCVLIDAERSFSTEWALTLGLDLTRLIYCTPETLEETGDLLYHLILKQFDLIVVDSIIALIPEAELERQSNEPTMALNAKINSLIAKKIYAGLSKSDTSIIFINQLREKIGVYGNPYTVSGGHGLLHLLDTRIEFRPGKSIEIGTKENKRKIGIELHLHCNKNRKGIPNRTSVVNFYYNGKLDNNSSLFYAGLKYGLINLTGKTYTYKNFKQVGKDNFIKTFNDWQKLEEDLWKIIK